VGARLKGTAGYTSSLICTYLIKNHRLRASEAASYVCLCRPGAVSAAQHHYLQGLSMADWDGNTPFACVGARQQQQQGGGGGGGGHRCGKGDVLHKSFDVSDTTNIISNSNDSKDGSPAQRGQGRRRSSLLLRMLGRSKDTKQSAEGYSKRGDGGSCAAPDLGVNGNGRRRSSLLFQFGQGDPLNRDV